MSAADVVDNILRQEPARAIDAMHEMIRARAEELVLARTRTIDESQNDAADGETQ